MAIIVGSVGVDVIPNVKNFSERVRASLIPQADKLGRELGQHLASNFKKVLDVELKDLPKARLELDTKALEASVENARRKVGELSKDTAKPNVKLDTAGFNADASRVELRLKTLQRSSGFAHFGLDTDTFNAKAAAVRLRMRSLELTKIEPEIKPKVDGASLDLVKAKLDELKTKVYSPNVKINDTQALVRILEIKARLEELGNKLAKPGVDLAGVLRAEAEIEKLNLELDEFGRKHVTATADVNTNSGARGIRRLINLALAFAPALTTVGIVGVGVAGALASSFAVAASGVGLFALATKGAFALLKTDEQKLKVDNTKLAALQATVDSAKGPKARAAAMAALHAQQQLVNQDLKQMGPAERRLDVITDGLKNTWKGWLRGTAIPGLDTLLGPLQKEFPKILKDLTPLFNGTVRGLRDLERAGFKALAAPFWQHFFTFLGKNAAPTIRTFGRIIGNVVTGLAGLVEAFAPLARKIDGGLLGITQKFANFGKNAGSGKSASFNNFLAYVKQNGPTVIDALKSIGRFLGELGSSLAKIGPGELKSIAGFLDVVTKFAKAHPALAQAAVAMLVFSKAVSALRIASLGASIFKLLNLLLRLKGGKGFSIPGLPKIPGLPGGAGGAAEGAAGAEGAGALGISAATLGGAAALVAGPLILSYLNGKFVPQGSHVLDQRGSHQVNTPGGGSVSVPILPHPARGGGGAGGRQRAADAAASHQYAPPNLPAAGSGAFSIPVAIFAHPQKPLAGGKGGKVTLPKSNIYVPPADLGVQYSKGDRKTIAAAKSVFTDVNTALGNFFGNGSGVSGPPSIPLAISTKGANKAALDLVNVQRAQKGLKPIARITVSSPGAKNTSTEIQNVNRAQRGLKPTARIAVSAPGGNLSTLTLINVGRAAKGLPPIKHINVSSPGAKGARADIDRLAHQSGLLPPNKHINTSAPGARGAILDMINLDRKAHGLPPLKRIPTTAPGADKATQDLIKLAQRAGLIPKSKSIKTDTPGAKDAIGKINTLLQRAGILPKGKSIKTSVPGATDAILHYLNLYQRAHNLPLYKKIPTTAPHAPESIQQMIDLARRVGLVPKSHDTKVGTPGAAAAKTAIDGVKSALGAIKPNYSVALKVIGSASDALKNFHFARGGVVDGPPGTDVVPAMLTAREYVQPRHVVEREGVPAMDALRAGRAMIIPKPKGFAAGGLVEGYADGGLVINTKNSGLGPIKTGIPRFMAAATAQIGADVTKAIQDAFSKLAASGGGGGGAGQWLGVVTEALSLLHQPVALAGLFLRVIAGESGGNPAAINLYDSNARRGTPSVGLAQVIGPTFAAWAGPFRNVGPFKAGVSINPLANVYAGLNYGIHTYGSVANIPGIASELHGGGYKPYARGGFAFGGVPIKVGERGSEIFTPATDGYVTPHNEIGGPVSIRVFIGNEEIRDIARVEVDRNAVAAGRSIAAGRRIVR